METLEKTTEIQNNYLDETEALINSDELINKHSEENSKSEDNSSQENKDTQEKKITTAVQTLVDTLVTEIKKTTEPVVTSTTTTSTTSTSTTTPPPVNPYYKENIPFLVQLKFTKWTPEIERKIMDIFMHDEELLPGLKINRLYNSTATHDGLYLEKILDKLDSIKVEVDNYRSELDLTMKRLLNNEILKNNL